MGNEFSFVGCHLYYSTESEFDEDLIVWIHLFFHNVPHALHASMTLWCLTLRHRTHWRTMKVTFAYKCVLRESMQHSHRLMTMLKEKYPFHFDNLLVWTGFKWGYWMTSNYSMKLFFLVFPKVKGNIKAFNMDWQIFQRYLTKWKRIHISDGKFSQWYH